MVVSEFTARTVARVTSVSLQQLKAWADSGLITPSYALRMGRREVRYFSLSSLIEVKVAVVLYGAGIAIPKVRRAIEALREVAPDAERVPAELELVSDGWSIYSAAGEAGIAAITGTLGPFYWRMKVGRLARELVQQVEALPHAEETTLRADGHDYPVVMFRDPVSDWWIGSCPTIQGCITQGKTKEELREMLADAISLLREPEGGNP